MAKNPNLITRMFSSVSKVALRDFKKQVGCLAADRAFKADYKSYKGSGDEPPPELVQSETHGWSFTEDARHETAIIGFGNSSSQVGLQCVLQQKFVIPRRTAYTTLLHAVIAFTALGALATMFWR